MKRVQVYLPATPEAGVYAGLDTDAVPAITSRTVTLSQPEYGRRPRRLSEKQGATFLGVAAQRIQTEARDRNGRYIRRLDAIHASGCRTKQQRWDALASLAEPMLAKVDLATLALGWLDSTGAFRLNRQRGLAHDGALTECRVSRTLTDLETAGYVRRKVRRIYKNGLHWISRVTIHLRPRFFIDLGLGHLLAEARTTKKAARASKLREISANKQRSTLQDLSDHQQRKESHRRAEGARAVKAEQSQAQQAMQAKMARNAEVSRLAKEHPELDIAGVRALVDKTHPLP